jgi:hypothetical protein
VLLIFAFLKIASKFPYIFKLCFSAQPIGDAQQDQQQQQQQQQRPQSNGQQTNGNYN